MSDTHDQQERAVAYVRTARSQILHADISAGPRYAILAKLDAALAILDAVSPQEDNLRAALEAIQYRAFYHGGEPGYEDANGGFPEYSASTKAAFRVIALVAQEALNPADPEAQQ